MTEGTIDLVRSFGMNYSVSITSLHNFRLGESKAYAPDLPTGWLVRNVDESVVKRAKDVKLDMICPRADQATAELVNDLHQKGFLVRARDVSDEALMAQMVHAGADGMTVNFPDKLMAFLENYQQE